MTVPNMSEAKGAFAYRPIVERYYCTCGAAFEGISQADVRRQQFEHMLAAGGDENDHQGVPF